MNTSKNPRAASSGPALVGLAMLGWGLAMVLGIMPHEDRIVGAGLAAFGAALLATRRGLPTPPTLPAWVVLGLGFSAITLVLGYRLVFGSAFDAPKLAILALGLALVASAPFLRRQVRLPLRGRPVAPVGSLVAYAIAIMGTPLAMWALQASFKSLLGTTPVEAFVRVALIPPVGAFLWLIGLDPLTNGQTITYTTRQGAMSVDVGAACSGVQAMALFGAVLALYLFAERPGGRQLALWSFIGVAGVYVANLIRLVALMLVGYGWGSDALEQAHAQAGWMFFVAWALLFAWLARRAATARGGGPRSRGADAA